MQNPKTVVVVIFKYEQLHVRRVSHWLESITIALNAEAELLNSPETHINLHVVPVESVDAETLRQPATEHGADLLVVMFLSQKYLEAQAIATARELPEATVAMFTGYSPYRHTDWPDNLHAFDKDRQPSGVHELLALVAPPPAA